MDAPPRHSGLRPGPGVDGTVQSTSTPSSPSSEAARKYRDALLTNKLFPLQELCFDQLVSPASVLRARTFAPGKGDVVLVGPPRAGNGKLSMMLTCLARQWAGSWDELPSPPSVEGREMDDWSRAGEGGGRFKLFTSNGTAASFARFAQKPDGAKFVVIFRDPYDLRLSTYRFFCDLFDEVFEADVNVKFSQHMSPKDMCALATPVSDFHTPLDGVRPEAYESNFVGPWIQLLRKCPQSVHVVFYEDLIKDPLLLLQELAAFLACPLSEELGAAIVSELAKASQRLRDHHSKYHRVDDKDGGVGDGLVKLDQDSVRNIREWWTNHVAHEVDVLDKDYASYESFYAKMHVTEYPFPIEDKLQEKYNKRVAKAQRAEGCCNLQ